MNILITGTSRGMGREIALKFLTEGHIVYGLDVDGTTIHDPNYIHYECDVSVKDNLPNIDTVNILINNAGVQGTDNDIDVNLKGVINCTEKYALNNKDIKAVVNQAAASGTTGADFGEYVASKAGVVGYTKYTAKEIAKYSATCNSISFGGVLSPVNWGVMNDSKKWNKIISMTPLKKWATPAEAAEWIYFLAAVNKSCTAQDIVIDNGEMFNQTFIW